MQEDDQHKKELLSEVAKQRPRDAEGHFIHGTTEIPQSSSTVTPEPTPTSSSQHAMFENIPGVSVENTKDENTLVDVHINNPLKKVVALLEDIKKQKAFTFDIKGSLGLAGVVVVLTTFGLFGGGAILCDRGVATQTGIVKVLQVTENDESELTWITPLTQKYFNYPQSVVKNRVVLLPQNGTPLHIIAKSLEDVAFFNGQSVIVTGKYNSCSQTLTINDKKAIELADN